QREAAPMRNQMPLVHEPVRGEVAVVTGAHIGLLAVAFPRDQVALRPLPPIEGAGDPALIALIERKRVMERRAAQTIAPLAAGVIEVGAGVDQDRLVID